MSLYACMHGCSCVFDTELPLPLEIFEHTGVTVSMGSNAESMIMG